MVRKMLAIFSKVIPMKTIKETTKLAKLYLGQTGEKFWKYVFPNYKYVNGSSTPYCACFASYLAKKAGISVPGFPGGYCPSIKNAWKKSGKMITDPKKLKQGDFIVFDWQGDGIVDHIGYVTGNNGSYISTIEGNTNGGIVAQRTRAYSTISGGYRPTYAKETVAVSTGKATPKTSDSQSTLSTPSSVSSAAVSKPKPGTWQTTVSGLYVRTGPGTKYKVKPKSQLTRDGQAHSDAYGCLKKGTKITVSEVKEDKDGLWWGKIPSGWCCLYYKPNSKWYAKRL